MRLLLVEDNRGDAALVQTEIRAASREAVEVTWVVRLADAVSRLDGAAFDVCLLDLSLPDAFGAAAVQGIRAAAPELPVVILTGLDDDETATLMLREGGQDYLLKGSVDGAALLRAIRHATERQHLESELRQNRARFADFARASSDWYWETDAELRFTWFSTRFGQTTGIDPDSLLGRPCDETLLAAAPHRDSLRQHLPFRDGAYTVAGAGGTPVHFHVSGVPVVDRRGDFLGYRGTGADVTRLKETEHELKESRLAAERASKAKSIFLANMSHELRTPLNAILGFAEIIIHQMMGPVGTTKYLEYAADIHASGDHLLDLINDVLDVSKVEAGKRVLALETVDPAMVLRECLLLVTGRADEGGVLLRTEMPARPPLITADRRAVKQCLLNLLSNAVKFTPADGTVTARVTAAEGWLTVVVRDTGIGIPPAELPRLLHPFEQVDNSCTRRQAGTGLGLALTKALVEMHGGTIAVTAPAGGGTEVTLTFPFTPPPRTG